MLFFYGKVAWAVSTSAAGRSDSPVTVFCTVIQSCRNRPDLDQILLHYRSDDSFRLYWTLYFGMLTTNSYVCGWWRLFGTHKLQSQCLVATSRGRSRCYSFIGLHSHHFIASTWKHKQFQSGFWGIWSSIFPDETAKHVHVAARCEHREGGLWNDPPTQKIREQRSKKTVWLDKDLNHIIQVNRQSLCQISLWNLIGAANQLKG